MIGRSLRAGHSFTSAVQLVGQEIANPVGGLFKTAYDQQLLGLRMNDALANMNERIDSLDLRFFTTAVGINTEIGGNLAEILDKLAETIRERAENPATGQSLHCSGPDVRLYPCLFTDYSIYSFQVFTSRIRGRHDAFDKGCLCHGNCGCPAVCRVFRNKENSQYKNLRSAYDLSYCYFSLRCHTNPDRCFTLSDACQEEPCGRAAGKTRSQSAGCNP